MEIILKAGIQTSIVFLERVKMPLVIFKFMLCSFLTFKPWAVQVKIGTMFFQKRYWDTNWCIQVPVSAQLRYNLPTIDHKLYGITYTL